MTSQPKQDRCVLTRHDVQNIKDLVFIVGGNSESSAQKAIFEILANNMRRSRPAPSPEIKQAWEQGYQDGQASVQHDLNLIEQQAAAKAREDVLKELVSASEQGCKALLDKLDELRTEGGERP